MNWNTSSDLMVYLAGKITKNGWRSEHVKGLRGAYTDSDQASGEPWPILYDALGDGLHYVGPYFVSCDHGCTHGTDSHATTGGCVTARGEFGDEVVWKHAGDDENVRVNVARMCLNAINAADVVIAVVEDDAHGTMVEIGYALAKGKTVITVNATTTDGAVDWGKGEGAWFPRAVAGRHMLTADLALSMLRTSVGRARERRLCESPIELQFYDAMRERRSTLDAFVPQVVVADGKYRLDFGDPARKIGLELDGYEFHSTKDQFTKDKKRQRELELLGWRLIRFSGREVHDDARACVTQAIQLVESLT